MPGLGIFDFERWEIVVSKETDARSSISPREISFEAKEAIKNYFYDSEMTVRDFLMMNPRIERKFNHFTFHPFPEEKQFLSDGSSLVEFRVPVTGEFLRLLAPKTGGGIPIGPVACPLCGQPWPEDKEIPEGVVPVPIESEDLPRYTGLIIDARRTELKPCLFLKVLNEDGKEVYGPAFVDADEVISKGLVQYTRSLRAAYDSERVGNFPLLINAVKSAGRNKSDIIISNYDGKRIHNSSHYLKLLKRCRVVVVLPE